MNNQVATLNTLLDSFLSNYASDSDKTQASRTLSTFSQHQKFINIAMALLSSYQLTEHKLLLLSCMIKDKFRYDFELLDLKEIMTYYQKLCEFASKFGTKCKPFFCNVSESLALIYVNQLAYRDLSFNDYLKRFTTDNPNDFVLYNYYFKILEECVQAVISSKVVLDLDSRKSAKERLINQQLQVIQILNQSVNFVCENPSMSEVVSKERIIKCFTSWIELKYVPQIYNNLHTTSLLHEVVVCLKREWFQMQAASECLKAIIYKIQSPQQNCQLYQYLGSTLHQLLPYIDLIIANSNVVEVEDLISLVVFFSQRFAHILVKTYTDTTRDFLMSLVRYMNTGLQKIVEVLIEFWQDILSLFLSAKEEQKLSPHLKMDLPTAILHGLVQQCTYPVELIKQLDNIQENRLGSRHEEGEQIYGNRNASKECFNILCDFLGINCYIDYILHNISELDPEHCEFFSMLQGYLFALIPGIKKLHTITQSVQVIVQTYQHLITFIHTVPTCVKRSFLRIFQAIFSIKIQDCNLVQKMFQFTTQCLPDNMLIENASKTLCKGCENNPKYLYPYISQMSTLVEKYPLEEIIVRSFICLASYNHQNASFYISKCLEFLISYMNDNFMDVLRLKECIYSLNTALKTIKEQQFQSKKQVIINFVECSWSFIIKTLRIPQKYSQDQDSKIQRVVKLLKTIMRALKQDFIPYLSQLFTIVNECFARYPICSYIYLLEIAVTVYCNNHTEQMQHFLKNLYESFTENAFKHLQSPQSIDRYCYLIDDFLGMNSRLLLYKSKIVVGSSHFQNLIRFITSDCLQSNSSKAIKATYSFLNTLYMIYWSEEFIEDYNLDQQEDERDHKVDFKPTITDESLYIYLNGYLKEMQPSILKKMLQHLSTIPPENTKEQILNTILSSIKAFPDVSPQIWKVILSDISSNILLSTQKELIVELLQDVRQSFSNFSRTKVVIKEINSNLNLIVKRMVIADKRRRINLKD